MQLILGDWVGGRFSQIVYSQFTMFAVKYENQQINILDILCFLVAIEILMQMSYIFSSGNDLGLGSSGLSLKTLLIHAYVKI